MGPLIIDIAGTELSSEDRSLLTNPLIGGIILFSRNYQGIEQLQHLIYSIRNLRSEPFLITVDHEGGRVQRFQQGFTQLPPCAFYYEAYAKNAEDGLTFCKNAGWLMAAELLSLGIDLSFAPVLDLEWGRSDVLKSRAFHQDPHVVTELAAAFIAGMKEAGMAATGKHFPGHGYVIADSHVQIPVDDREWENIAAADLIPFKNLITQLQGIMPAHVIYSKVHAQPACFSAHWLQNVLRNQLRFQGVIFSDDLSMMGASGMGDYACRTQAALQAGCDALLLCNNRAEVYTALDALENYSSSNRESLLNLAGAFHYTRTSLYKEERWLSAHEQLKSLTGAALA